MCALVCKVGRCAQLEEEVLFLMAAASRWHHIITMVINTMDTLGDTRLTPLPTCPTARTPQVTVFLWMFVESPKIKFCTSYHVQHYRGISYLLQLSQIFVFTFFNFNVKLCSRTFSLYWNNHDILHWHYTTLYIILYV